MSFVYLTCHGNFPIVYLTDDSKNEKCIILSSGFKIFLNKALIFQKYLWRKMCLSLINHGIAMTGEGKITLQMSTYLLSNYKAFSSKDLKRQQTDQLTCFH